MNFTSEISFIIGKEDLIKALQNSKTEDSGEIRVSFTEVKCLCTSEKSITPDDYYHFNELIKKNGINLKDIRNIITMAYVWWAYGPLCTDDVLIKHYLMRKDKFREKVYSGELITRTLDAISTAKDPVSNLYSRLKRTNPEDYISFEEFYKAMYTNEVN